MHVAISRSVSSILVVSWASESPNSSGALPPATSDDASDEPVLPHPVASDTSAKTAPIVGTSGRLMMVVVRNIVGLLGTDVVFTVRHNDARLSLNAT